MLLNFWIINYLITIVIIVFAITKNKKNINTLYIIILGTFIVSAVSVFPIVYNDVNSILQSVLLSIQTAVQIFTVGADYKIISRLIISDYPVIQYCYRAILSFLFIFAPLLTATFIVSLFKDVLYYFKYKFTLKKDIYIFSELNEKTLTLAEDIKNNNNVALIVFNDVFNKNEEGPFELIERAKNIKAVLFRKDIIVFNFFKKNRKLNFFVLNDDNGSENIKQTLGLIEKYRECKNVKIYVFSSRNDFDLIVESKVKIEEEKNGSIPEVIVVNDIRTLIYTNLYEHGFDLFFKGEKYNEKIIKEICEENNIKPVSDNTAEMNTPSDIKDVRDYMTISSVIVGLGEHGKEMLKALAWYCQIPGVKTVINAFDISDGIEDEMKAECIDLLRTDYHGFGKFGDARYDIKIHSGCDVKTKTFYDLLERIDEVDYVFVCLGGDEINADISMRIRSLYLRKGIRPKIQTIIYDDVERNAITSIEVRKATYDIECIGYIKSTYSQQAIMVPEYDKIALKYHIKYNLGSDRFPTINEVTDEIVENKPDKNGKRKAEIEELKKSFRKSNYNYRSNCARAIHHHLRDSLGLNFYGSNSNDKLKIQFGRIIEHNRWNAYTRSIGFTFSGSTERKSRNDMAKLHNDLVPFFELSSEEQKKDS